MLCTLQANATEMQTTRDSDRELPGVVVGAGQVATATIEAVNKETREITLREADGTSSTIVAGDEVRNFDQIEVGDRVVVRQSIGMVMALSPTASGLRERTDTLEVGRAAPGQKPAGVVRKTVEAKVSVMDVDPKARTITLKGPLRTATLPVAEDINLDAIKVGDMVDAVYQETIAISVEPAAAE
jgi:hypothetical protein